ncbi:MAG: OadG family protein [Clostridia bacterium]|nr:OadG family protein [Clostridia bacterium]
MLDKLILGITVTLIGILMVFFILFLLIMAINLLHVFITPKKKEKKVEPIVEEPVVAEEVIEEVVEDDAVIAAITAAVYMMMSLPTPTSMTVTCPSWRKCWIRRAARHPPLSSTSLSPTSIPSPATASPCRVMNPMPLRIKSPSPSNLPRCLRTVKFCETSIVSFHECLMTRGTHETTNIGGSLYASYCRRQ